MKPVIPWVVVIEKHFFVANIRALGTNLEEPEILKFRISTIPEILSFV